MEIFNNILCISGTELIKSDANPAGVMSLSYYCKLSAENKKDPQKGIRIVRTGGNGRTALIEFDSLPVKYRDMVEKLHPDPRKEAITAPFVSKIKHDAQTREVFTSYRYDGKSLPSVTIDKYCNDVAIFDALQPIIEGMIAQRKASTIRKGKVKNLGTQEMSIWQYALTLVDSARQVYPCNMPKT